MLLRYFWEDWMELKDYQRFPALGDYAQAKIEGEFGTKVWKEAERLCIKRTLGDHIRYDPGLFGSYPDLLQPYLNEPRYSMIYQNDRIVGREES